MRQHQIPGPTPWSLEVDDMVLQLDATAEARATRLHRDSIIIDTLSGGPSLYTGRMTQQTLENLATGKSAIEAVVTARDLLLNEIVSDPAVQRQYLAAWDDAGVTCVSATQGGLGIPPFSFESSLHAIAHTTRLVDALPDHLVKVTRAEDIRRAKKEGRHGILMNFQNTAHLGTNLKILDLFYNLGIRVIQLTYNMRNFAGDGCTERTDAGLSHFGVALVRRMNEMGILVDLSHCGTQTAWDAVRASTKPVAFTHTFSKVLSKHDRGKTDDLLKAVADTGGYVGVLVVPFFISDRPDVTLDAAVDHVRHVVDVCGIDHVGVGTDWGAVFPRELGDKMNQE
ncbi:MAG: membrane dipeptidase, partial [Armatimonadetes bacterium]|nr:membrane dipeptidase [Armatimonadota bacterium]